MNTNIVKMPSYSEYMNDINECTIFKKGYNDYYQYTDLDTNYEECIDESDSKYIYIKQKYKIIYIITSFITMTSIYGFYTFIHLYH